MSYDVTVSQSSDNFIFTVRQARCEVRCGEMAVSTSQSFQLSPQSENRVEQIPCGAGAVTELTACYYDMFSSAPALHCSLAELQGFLYSAEAGRSRSSDGKSLLGFCL